MGQQFWQSKVANPGTNSIIRHYTTALNKNQFSWSSLWSQNTVSKFTQNEFTRLVAHTNKCVLVVVV